LLQDFKYALRTLAKSRGFTAVAVLTLALGVGANTAIFSIVHAVLLAPLPFPDPGQLVVVHNVEHGEVLQGPSPADGLDYARLNHTLAQFAMWDYWRKNVSAPEAGLAPREMAVGLTPREYFEALGIRPIKGRLFTDEENHYGRHYVAVISQSFWRDRLAGDPNVLGRVLHINDEPYTIVGVVPDAIPLWMASLNGSEPAAIWTPLAPYANFFAESSRASHGMTNLARLKPGVTIEQAQADLQVIARQLAQQYPVDKDIEVTVSPLAAERAGTLRSSLLLLLGAVGLILLIACSNVANLLLVRNSARRREFAIRAALGGARIDLLSQILWESALLAVLGGLAGLLLAESLLSVMLRLRPDRMPQLASVTINTPVFLFSFALLVISTLLFALWPAFSTTRVSLLDVINAGGRTTTAAGRSRLRRLLVASEVAFSLMLMIAAGLLVRSIVRLHSQDLGFRSDHLLRAHLYLPPARYSDPASIVRFIEQYAERVRSLPGVRESTFSTLFPPFFNRWDQEFSIPGRTPVVDPNHMPTVSFGLADEHFLATLEIPLLRGRNFTAADAAGQPVVALVNQTFVRQYFPREEPLGKRVRLGRPDLSPEPGSARAAITDVVIIGVIGDTHNRGLSQPVVPQLIALTRQMPALNFGFKDIIVRTSQEPKAIIGAMADELRRMDPDMPLAEAGTFEELMTRSTADRRFTTILLTCFASLGVLLAMVGVYGVIAYLVAERTHEIGIRMALGASIRNVLWFVARPAMLMSAIGVSVGIAGAWSLRQFLGSLLFGISAADPLTFAAGAAALLLAVIIAIAVPAWRASKVDPMVALRYE
jgi:putative ABC transport system permease protein